jgi:hypothetical protein
VHGEVLQKFGDGLGVLVGVDLDDLPPAHPDDVHTVVAVDGPVGTGLLVAARPRPPSPLRPARRRRRACPSTPRSASPRRPRRPARPGPVGGCRRSRPAGAGRTSSADLSPIPGRPRKWQAAPSMMPVGPPTRQNTSPPCGAATVRPSRSVRPCRSPARGPGRTRTVVGLPVMTALWPPGRWCAGHAARSEGFPVQAGRYPPDQERSPCAYVACRPSDSS